MFYLFFLIYNLIWILAIIIFIFYYIMKGKTKILSDRLNLTKIENKRSIWLHASSVGEVKIAAVIIREIRRKTMEPIILTVVTEMGYAMAETIEAEHFCCRYVPFDFLPIVLNFITKHSIRQTVFIETEIWPSFIIANSWNNMRQFIVNARLSDRSFPKYKFFKFYFKPLLVKLNLVLAQSKEDKERFTALGLQKEKAIFVRNIKYDILDIVNDVTHEKDDLFYNRPVFTAGSLRAGEEALLIDAMIYLNSKFDNFLGVIAPRHLKNIEKIESLLHENNLDYVCYSDLKKFGEGSKYLKRNQKFIGANIIVLDVMGALIDVYKNSDLVFVGGSLVKKGGQNIIEPASLGKLVLFGPYMENFREVSARFLSSGGAIQVENVAVLKKQAEKYLIDKNERSQFVHRVLKCLKDAKGGAKESVEYLLT
ncbi:MAG: hypothetical protein GY817_04100 [bacterium]|nr:hypothetical protein [bacterium]